MQRSDVSRSRLHTLIQYRYNTLPHATNGECSVIFLHDMGTILRIARIILWFLVLAAIVGCDSRETSGPAVPSSQPAATSQPGSASSQASAPGGGYAGAESCQECHEEAYKAWRDSHHANALRDLMPELDGEAFVPERPISHGTQTSLATMQDGQYTLRTMGQNGELYDFHPTGVIGVWPLWQYLIPVGDGRLQVTELAFDPDKKEWFDVYGDEDRQSHEWGHWSNRGMNWNSMCATCHTTDFQKNYDRVTDGYRSTYQVQGVDCEQCHGPMQAHVDWQDAHPDDEDDPTIQWLDNDQYLAVCGSCHARRGDLTGRFKSGDKFLDHYDPVLPDLSDVYYPDGQVREEDFEYVAFTLSYMNTMGVRCFTCHDSHSGKTRKQGNDLCLQCHERKMTTRIAIDPAEHSHHPSDKPGFLCIDCHMPQTVYMARHWRHDHGMTIPDPVLTKAFGIPNGCTRCHAEEGVDWAIEWVEKWYGQRMERPTRQRARLLARIKAGDEEAVPGLLALLPEELNPAWRAVYVRFLAPLLTQGQSKVGEAVVAALLELIDDPSPLVQASVIEALSPIVSGAVGRLVAKLDHPVQLVRVKAAWALRQVTTLSERAHHDLMTFLDFNEDQPTGVFHKGNYYAEIGRPEEALAWFEKATQWDPGAAPFRHSYAVVLSRLGRLDEALMQLAEASNLDREEAFYPYSMGLLYAEMGRFVEARDALRAATARASHHGRFWYNLALAEDRLGDTDAALDAMFKAEALEPHEPTYPYVRATLLLRQQKTDAARRALERVLQIDPTHQQARQLIGRF